MKITSLLFAILFIAIFTCGRMSAQTAEGCLQLYCDPVLCYNPDSVMIDTCSESTTHGKWYSKLGFEIEFDSGVITLGYGERDSILEVGWEAIDTSFAALRSAFEDLYVNRGPYVLRKINPQDTMATSRYSRWFLLRFFNYTLVDSVMFDLFAMSGIAFEFHRPKIPNAVILSKEQINFALEVGGKYIKLSNKEKSGRVKVYLYDYSGILHSEYIMSESVTIDIASLHNGIYYVVVDNSVIGKFIKR